MKKKCCHVRMLSPNKSYITAKITRGNFICCNFILFAAILFNLLQLFYLQQLFLLFAAIVFYLQQLYLTCSNFILFAATLFNLQQLFYLQHVPCGPPQFKPYAFFLWLNNLSFFGFSKMPGPEQPHVVGFIFGCEDNDFLIFFLNARSLELSARLQNM